MHIYLQNIAQLIRMGHRDCHLVIAVPKASTSQRRLRQNVSHVKTQQQLTAKVRH